ncbi:hypothetical protein DINM_001487 [Dirofilaria immitis]|nr:hypothetical protein [Dirofilaria immitis]
MCAYNQVLFAHPHMYSEERYGVRSVISINNSPVVVIQIRNCRTTLSRDTRGRKSGGKIDMVRDFYVNHYWQSEMNRCYYSSLRRSGIKRSNPTETSSKTDKLLSKKLTKYDFGSSEEEKPISNMEEKFADEKFKDDKIEIVSMKHQVPSLPSIHINSTQDLPDFAHEELQISTPENFKPIAQNLIKRKMKSTKSSKAERISYEKTNQLLQSKDFEKDSLHKYCFPSCMQYTFLRLIALILLFCAWIIVYAFPCLRFTYHVPVIKDGIVQSVEVKIPLRETCQLMPHWWSDQKKFVGRIIESTRYFQALNLSMNQTKKHFEIFDDENLIKIIKPFNGQIFVIFGCIVLAFPILLLLMFLRCLSGEEDLTEEAMFDLFYMSSGEEIRSIMDAMCGRYLEHSVIIDGFLNAEEVESRKYLKMAACLHYDKPLEYMSELVLEGVFIESNLLSK